MGYIVAALIGVYIGYKFENKIFLLVQKVKEAAVTNNFPVL